MSLTKVIWDVLHLLLLYGVQVIIIITSVDNKKCVLLVLLDMSAAFDTGEQSTQTIWNWLWHRGFSESVAMIILYWAITACKHTKGPCQSLKGWSVECPRDLSSDPKATHHMCHPSLLLLELVKSLYTCMQTTQTLCKLQSRRFSSSPSKNGAMYSANPAVVMPELSQIKRWKNWTFGHWKASTTQEDHIWHQY